MPASQHEKENVLRAIDSAAPRWRELALTIHDNPELGLEEFKASRWLCEALAAEGFSVTSGAGGLATSFTARHACSGAGPAIAFLAEYDALPGLGHACSHNLICTASGLAASALRHCARRGAVCVIGTPAEENFGAKVPLLKAGVFAGIDAALMAHGGPTHHARRSFIGLRQIVLEFHGRAAHASVAPDTGVNALDAVILLFNGVALMRQQLRSEARVHGIITHGGTAPNIIPERACAEFFVRSCDAAYLDELERRLLNCARGAAEATGTRLVTRHGTMNYLPAKRNSLLEDCYENNLRLIGATVQGPGDRGLGSTDFGNVSQSLPALHAYFKMTEPGVESHTPEFAAASRSPKGLDGMVQAASALALTALDLIEDRELLAAVQEIFRTGSTPYRLATPAREAVLAW